MNDANVMLAWVRLQFVVRNPGASSEDRNRAQMRFERAYNKWVRQ